MQRLRYSHVSVGLLFVPKACQVPLSRRCKFRANFSFGHMRMLPKTRAMTIEEILRMSFSFIDEHPDALWDEVPEDLLKCWHILIPLDKYLEGNYQSRYEYMIFEYALKKYAERADVKIPEEKKNELFCAFQMLLMLPYICRYTTEKRPLFPIFDFGFLLAQ
ncbi:hypothetical protein [Culturomica massiliensis]|uniref:hypothetical protein n=2 Tax=Odoribacteraceae TaxID=1853231 RepID=UPI0011C45F35|nr:MULTISPECIES: hypothetical protein [Odoribacteraceae]